MGKIHESLNEHLRDFIKKQKMFFVSTAPLASDGLVNCSPKGLDSFRILDDHTVAYIDLTGSGVETIAHLKENQRITFLFCAFDGPPKLLRLYGKGKALEKGTEGFEKLKDLFPKYRSTRAIIKADIFRIADSCGYTVPLYEFKEDRDTWKKWGDSKSDEELAEYRKVKNDCSLDGLPGLEKS